MTRLGFGLEKKKTIILAVLGIVGIILVVLGYLAPWKKNNSSDKENLNSSGTMEYIRDIENKIRSMTEIITGDTNVSVIVSTENGTEYVYVSNENIDGNDISKEYITIKNEKGTNELVLLKEVYPTITGVSIACPGGDDSSVKRKIIDLVSTAFGLSKNRICVVGTK